MRSVFLLALAAVLSAALSAQQSSTFFSIFDAGRGSVIAPAAGGNLWLGGQKDERVLLAKLNPEGKILEKHSVGFEGPGLDLEHLTDLFEESDGSLVGCGNFEGDNLGRGFVFRYNPATRQTLWARVVRSGSLNYLYGITQLGPGGDYVLYGNPHNPAGDDAELLQLSRTTGQIVTGKAKRFGIGPADNIVQALYHNGAMYTCGRFTGTEPYPSARMRNAVCKIDTATLEPVWTRTGPLPTSSSGQFHGRDLIIDNETIVSTFSGDHASPDLLKSEVYLQKNDLDGNLLWVRQYKLPAFAHEFAEEIINLPDGYLLYGHDIRADTSRLFLLKTDKEGNAATAVIIDFGLNDEFPEIPARSKILRLGDALFFTALSENNLGQTQGILVKADLNGLLNDSCDFVQKTPVTFSDWDSAMSQSFVPTVNAGTVTLAAATISQTTPDLTFEKKCGATGTCPTLPDLSVTLDSVTCTDGNSRLHFTVCNVGGQPYDGPSTLFLYDQNPLTGPAKFITGSIGGGQPIPPGECISWGIFGSDVDLQTPYELDTFTRLYALIGANYTVTTPIPIDGFPYPPNQPECNYLNNLDSISIPPNLCGDCQTPVTFVKKLGAPQRRELAFSMCAAADGNVYVAGKQGNNPMIAKITTQGEQIWVRNFPPINPNEPIEWAQIIEDSEGKIVVCGTEGASPSNRRAIAMRYDPVAVAVLWYKRYQSDKPTGVAIVEKSPGGDFVLQTNYQTVSGGGVSAQTQFFTLNRADGNTKGGSVGYQNLDNNIVVNSTVLNNGMLYTVGSWVTKTNDKALPFLARVSPNTFIPEWAYLSIPDTSSGAARWMPPADVAFDGDFAIVAGSGHLNPLTPTQNIFVYLQKHNPDGSLVWLKRYDIQMAPEEVLPLPNAYIVFGRMVGTNRFGMLKTDLQGNVLRAAVLDAAPTSPNSVGFVSRQGLLLRLPLQLLMLDHTWEDTESDLVLLRTDMNFGLDDDCDLLQTVQVSSSTLSATTEPALLSIGTNTPASVALPANAVFQADSLPLRKLCPACSCEDKPDIAFRIESVGCDSAAFVAYRLCNTGKQPFTGALQIGVYGSNPMTGAATLLDLFLLPTLHLAPDSCQTGTLKNLAFWGNYNKVYTLAGIENGQSTPVDPAGFPYNGIAECDYANNLDSLVFQYPPAPQKPELGPDRILCAGQNAVLNAGTGFVAYKWSNGQTTQTVAVNSTGIIRVEATDACGRILRDTVSVTVLPPVVPTTVTIQFYPGDTVMLAGIPYTQPGAITQTLTTGNNCDSVVTYILERVITNLDLACPPALTVTVPANASSAPVAYPLPAAATDCPDAGITLTRLQGPPPGGQFPLGNTLVCHEAANQCGIRDTCCFTVTVQKSAVDETACDVKTPAGSCIRYEILNIRLDSLGRPRYRFRLTNTCASPLQYAWFQLPGGITAKAPVEGSIYTSASGNTYQVRNPNAAPFHSVRFKSISGALNNGKSDVFEYTLPKQAQPLFILVSVKLADGNTYDAHLNTFACPVQPYVASAQEPAGAAQNRGTATEGPALLLRPNPTSGLLLVDLQMAEPDSGQPVLISVLNALGQLVLEGRFVAENNRISLPLPEGLANGLYYLTAQSAAGGRQPAARFVLER